MRFCVLASGSAGNASLLADGRFGVLIDVGLGPRSLGRRLERIGASWDDVQAVLLTHVHGDHWNERSLAHLDERAIPLYCHPSHADALADTSRAFASLRAKGRVSFYEVDRELRLAEAMGCRPIALSHDCGTTCGFRFDGGGGWQGQTWALGYAADLGSWDSALADALAQVDLLALEFNHDEEMERTSGRSWPLVRRVLGDQGHLSNTQAARLLAEVVARSPRRPLRHLVQLHLSRQCNRPELAQAAARRVLQCLPSARVHTAAQDRPGAWLSPYGPRNVSRRGRTRIPAVAHSQPLLPGWEE